MSFFAANAQVPSNISRMTFFTTKYTKEKVWDVQRDPAYPTPAMDWTLSGLKGALDATGATIDWGVGRYLMFFAEPDRSNNPKLIADDLFKTGLKYNITLKLFERNGMLVKIVSKQGAIVGIGTEGFMYEAENQYGSFFTTRSVNAASVVKYKPILNIATKLSELKVGNEAVAVPDISPVNLNLPFFNAKYTKERVWDVQRSPAFPVAKQNWVLSGLKNPLDASGAPIDMSAGRYLMFVADGNTSNAGLTILDDVVKKGTKYNVSLNLYESNGKLVKVISKAGKLYGVGDKGFMYENEGSFGTFFSVFAVNASSVITYKPNVAQVTKLSEFSNTTTSDVVDNVKPNIEPVVTKITAGYYTLTAECSGKLLDVLDASPLDGAVIQQWKLNGNQAQHWKIDPIAGAPGYYTLTSRTSGKLLDVLDASKNDGAKIQQWKLNGNQAQHWKIEAVAGKPGYFVLTSRTSGKALSVVGESKVDGAKIEQRQVNGHSSQAWKLDQVR